MPHDKKIQLNINLQLFAGEKTEKPTPRRKTQARKKGQVLKSVELNSALILLLAFVALKISAPMILEEFSAFYSYTFSDAVTLGLSSGNLHSLVIKSVLSITKMLLPVVAVAMLGGLLASYAQVGFLFTTETLAPKFNRLNPLQGIKRMFSLRSLVELLKAFAKIGIITFLVYSAIKDDIANFPRLMESNLYQSMSFIGRMVFNVVLRVGIALLVLGILDYFYQRYEHLKSLKMTKEEVKQEYKEQEGDPKVKSRIKEKQRQMSMRRMMQAVPEADVVITNPTHYAVAVKYDAEKMGAPVVLAKGQDHIAAKIREIAKEHGIVLYENKPLAQALFKTVEIGDEIPADLYQAVAEVLAFVYKLKGKI